MAPPLEPLTFEDVTKVYREEKKSAGLTTLRHDFYSALRVLVEQLRRDYEKEAAADSYGAKARQLNQVIAKVREKALQIFDMRADKIMHMAVLGAAGGRADHSRLTEEERKLLDSALSQVQAMRNGLLDLPRPGGLEFTRMSVMPMPASADEPSIKVEELVATAPAPVGEAATSPIAVAQEEPPTKIVEPIVVKAQEAMAVTTSEPVEVAAPIPEMPRAASELVLLRILEDIPPFAGPSGTYNLGKEDIITLPASIGKALVKRGKAQEISVARP
jgi:DNA replication factor GINS